MAVLLQLMRKTIQLNSKRFGKLIFLMYLVLLVFVSYAQSPVSVQSAAFPLKKIGFASYYVSNSSLLDSLEKSVSMAEFCQISAAMEGSAAQKTNPLAMTLPALLRDALRGMQRGNSRLSVAPFEARFLDGNFFSSHELLKETEKLQNLDGIIGGAFLVKDSKVDIVSFYQEIKTSQFFIYRAVFDVFSIEEFPPTVLADFSQVLWSQVFTREELKSALRSSSATGADPSQPIYLNQDILAWQFKEAHDNAQKKFIASVSRTIVSIPITLLLFGFYQGYSEAAFRNSDFTGASNFFLGTALAGSAVSLGFLVDTFINLRQLLRTSF